MKKIVCLLIVLSMLVALVGCGKSNSKPTANTTDDNVQQQEPVKQEEPVKQPEPEKKPEPSKQEEKPKDDKKNGVRKEFKASMEAYEAFFDEYVKFMKSYDGSLAQMLKYTEFMAKYADAMDKLSKIGDEELTDDEMLLYTETMFRINQKLLEAVK